MVEGVYALDAEGRLTYMNAAASRMLGWSERSCAESPCTRPSTSSRRTDHRSPGRVRAAPGPRPKAETVRVPDDAFTREGRVDLPRCLLGGTTRSGPTSWRGRGVPGHQRGEGRAGRDQARARCAQLGRADPRTRSTRTGSSCTPSRSCHSRRPAQRGAPPANGRTEDEIIRPGELPSRRGEVRAHRRDRPMGRHQAARLAASGRRVQANLSAVSISSQDLLPLIESECASRALTPPTSPSRSRRPR